MFFEFRSILSAFRSRPSRTHADAKRHRVREHTRGRPRGGTTSVREYRRRNHR